MRAASLVMVAVIGAAAWTAGAEDASPGALRGAVAGAEGPAAGAEVAVGPIGWAPRERAGVASVTAGADGRFVLDRAPLGPVDVWVRPSGGEWTFGVRMQHPGLSDLELDARPRRGFGGMGGFGGEARFPVTGVVTDKAGKPIEGAAVGLRGDDTTWVRTDAKGQFTAPEASDGDGVIVRAAGYADALSEVKGKKKLAVKLGPAKTTVVRVEDAAGKPVAGAWVLLGDPDDVQGTTGFTSLFPPPARLAGGWTDAAGEARVPWSHTDDATTASAWTLTAVAPPKKATAGRPLTLRLAPMRPARATVTLRDGGAPVADVLLGLPHESDGGPDAISALPADAERGPVVVGRTDERGQCVVAHVPEGIDTLRVVGEMKLRAQVKLERIDAGEGR